MQIKVDIPDYLMAELERVSVQRQRPREELLQEAVDLFLARNGHPKAVQPRSAEEREERRPEQKNAAGVTPSPIMDPEERDRIVRQASGSLPYLADGLTFQQQIRSEWEPEHDPGYRDE